MIESLDTFDKSLMLYLNGFHSSFWDVIMIFISGKLSWLPLYIYIIGSIIYKYKKRSILIVAAIFISFAATDVISTQVFKKGVKRLRPCKNEQISDQLHVPHGCGGKYGFFSSHASNTFGLAAFVTLLFWGENKKWSMLFLWAFIVSYSRIYLGKHYPLDILCGALFGSLIGFWMLKLTLFVRYKLE